MTKIAGKKSKAKKTGTKKRKSAKSSMWQLKLYVAGMSGKSKIALENLEAVCEKHLKGKYEIEIIDLLKQPQLAKGDQIFAIPTLIKRVPEPVRKIIGDLSDLNKVLVGLDLKQIEGL